MVFTGNISVQLVDATTKRPFKEHRDRLGRTYVEVEPDAEYYIAVSSHLPRSTVIYVDVAIDGKDLGYSPILEGQEPPEELGSFSCEDGVQTKRSFKFQKPQISSDQFGASSPYSRIIMGNVTLQVSYALFVGCGPAENFQSEEITPERMNVKLTPDMEKKLLRTGQGSHKETEQCYECNEQVEKYGRGPTIENVKLHYCTTPGLIFAGILPKPPPAHLRTFTRRVPSANRKRTSNVPIDISKVKHQKIRYEGVASDGTRLNDGKEIDLFDLTCMDD